MIDWPPLLRRLAERGFDDWLSNENFLLLPPDRRPGRGEVLETLPSYRADLDVPLVDRLRADLRWMAQAGG